MSNQSENGVILLAVVFVIAVLGILVLQFSYFTRLDSTMAAHFRDREESYVLAQAGISQAISLLEEDKIADQEEEGEEEAGEEPRQSKVRNVEPSDKEKEKGQDDLQEGWAQPAQKVPLGNGQFIFKITDEDRKYNLNLLVVDAVQEVTQAREERFQAEDEEGDGSEQKDGEEETGKKSSPSSGKKREEKKVDDSEEEDEETKIDKEAKEGLIDLLDKLEVDSPKEIVKALLDWMDSDNEGSGEGSYYSSEDPGYPCKNAPLESIGELALIKDIGLEMLQGDSPREKIRVVSEEGEEIDLEEDDSFGGLRQYLTVYSDGKVNINTASQEVLETVLGEDQEDLAGDIIKKRDEEPFSSTEDVKDALAEDGDIITSKALDKFKVSSDYFNIISEGRVGRITTRIRAVVQRTKDHIRILFWRVES